MNCLYIGQPNIELPERSFLFIHDELPDVPRARIFDPLKHSINPLKNISYQKARSLAQLLYTLYPEAETTLTVRNGRIALLPALLNARRLDLVKSDNEDVQKLIADLMQSPIIKHFSCEPSNFRLNNSTVLARINRKELGDFDAIVLTFFLIASYQGQIIIPDFGFYGRNAHTYLVREQRLIAGVRSLSHLPLRLRDELLLMNNKYASGALYDDAVELAKYRRLIKDTNEWHDDITRSMSI